MHITAHSHSAQHSAPSAPNLSVIIPTCNRASTLAKSLKALCNQTYDNDRYELLIVDDGSSDETGDVAKRFATGRSPLVRYLHQANSGANRARNHGVRAAAGTILLFINDDIIASPTMVEEHVRAHEMNPDWRVGVLGRVTASSDNAPSRLMMLHLDWAYAQLAGRRELDWRAFFTCNVSLKKRLLDVGGGFEERIRYLEDIELAERLSHLGLRLMYCPDALGFHDHVLTEEEFLAVAVREAEALVTWSRISPHLRDTLGPLGLHPALPALQRLRERLAAAIINDATTPLLLALARRCPRALDRLSLRIYSRIYRAVRARMVDRGLGSGLRRNRITGVPERGTSLNAPETNN